MKVLGRSAADYLPERRSISALRAAAASCRGCDLYRHATQTVFGEGRVRAALMLVGEQPGDAEDRAGKPFVGPSGQLLRTSLAAAGIDARGAYITNAVKHFKFVTRGKRRIHAKPKTIEIGACAPWLSSEIAQVRPQLIVALGATAAQALLGPEFRLTHHRGNVFETAAGRVLATVHPSSILRAPDSAARERETAAFVADLRKAASVLKVP